MVLNKEDSYGFLCKCPSIKEICYHFYTNENKIVGDDLYKKELEYYWLNLLPEYYVKSLTKSLYPALAKLKSFLYYDDITLFFPEWRKIILLKFDNNFFAIYKKIMTQIKILEKHKNNNQFLNKNDFEINCKIDSLRIQAIYFLKEAYKNASDDKIKIELAAQYIYGNILPCNYKKALAILKSISNTDEQNKQLIGHMIKKVESSENTIIENLSKEQNDIFQNAEKGEILSILFVAFAFYTGFNSFPISRSLSIYYYRLAAHKSPHAMTLLGYLYNKGVIFPQNFKRALKCFSHAANDGSLKAEIIDCVLRKHLWRNYLIEFNIHDIFHYYLPSFKSMFPNDSFIISKINYCLSSKNDYFYYLTLDREVKLKSDAIGKCYKNIINCNISKNQYNKEENYYTNKVSLSFINKETIKVDDKKLIHIAKSYFYGINGFPVNYKEAAYFFKLAADKGDSEAQWRYAMMCLNFLGVENKFGLTEKYLIESSNSNDLKGKLLYALFLRENGDNHMFKKIACECYISGSLDSSYYYAMHCETVDESLEQSMNYYIKAANDGHFESLIRLINILKIKKKEELYEKYLISSVGIMNESLLIKLIHFYDRNKKYDQSNILIQMGITLNYQLFNAFLADHLLYGKGMDVNIERAEKLVVLAKNNNYAEIYWERYIYIMLEILIIYKKHNKAAQFLINNIFKISDRFRYKFILFYQKLDKNIARKYFIIVNFCYLEYQKCYQYILSLNQTNNANKIKSLYILENMAKRENNPYAMITLGRIYKQGKYVVRNLKTAIKYFFAAIKVGCHEAYYYIGKEYFYGRFLDQNYVLAAMNFNSASINNETRAGYYLYKIPKVYTDSIKDLNVLNELKKSVDFGYKRAMYKYGHRLITGKDKRIPINSSNKSEGIELIQQAAFQGYKKAIKYCKLHGINYKVEWSLNIVIDKNPFEVSQSDDIDTNLNTDQEDLTRSYNQNQMKKSNINNVKSQMKSDFIQSDHSSQNDDSKSQEDDSISDLINFWS